jgi:class 3 adenylate cyclase
MEYTVLGNAVNIAARFEAFVAQPGDIVLGEATLEALRGELEDLQVEPLGPQLLKGMQQPVEAFKLMEPVS